MPSTLRHASHSWFPCRDTPQSQTERSATILQPSCGQGACVNACSPAQDLSTARQQAAQWQQLKWTPPSTLSTKQLLEHATETLLISCAPCILSRRSSLPYLRTCAQDAFQNCTGRSLPVVVAAVVAVLLVVLQDLPCCASTAVLQTHSDRMQVLQ